MATCTTCGQLPNRCNCAATQPFCDQCSEDNSCAEIMDSACVIYHPEDDKPSKLNNLGMPNKSSAEAIFEAIDGFLGNKANVPITPVDTPSVDITASGTAGHTLKADLKVSPDVNNQLETRENGVYVKPYNEHYLVKVNAQDSPDFLEDQVVGGTDGVVSITTQAVDGMVQIQPSLDILCLLKRIREEFPDEFCALVNEICIRLGWTPDEIECMTEDLDLQETASGDNLPTPWYAFIDNGVPYFLSLNTSTAAEGKLWTINPETYSTTPTFTYINETRNGVINGGTYVAGQPYRGYALNSSYNKASNVFGYYDPKLRVLFVHGNNTLGMDYYDFTTNQWNKITLASGVTSNYLTSGNAGGYTHVQISSHEDTNLLVTGWAPGGTADGTVVIVVNKATKQLTAERNTSASPIAGPTNDGVASNPFTNDWRAVISKNIGTEASPDYDIIVGKGASLYKNLAIFSPSLTFKQQLVLPHSSNTFAGGGKYWQSLFFDREKSTIYVNDFMTKSLMIYKRVASSYTFDKEFLFTNDSDYASLQINMSIDPEHQELYMDLFYGDIYTSYSPGAGDAAANKMISYRVDRDTQEIKKVYIGELKGSNILLLGEDKFLTISSGTNGYPNPVKQGSFKLYTKNPDALKTGMVHVKTLKEVNLNSGEVTGKVKVNTPTIDGVPNPDYVEDYQDVSLCPVTYSLAPPDGLVMTAKTGKLDAEFGLDADVVRNPALKTIRLKFINQTTSMEVGSTEWIIPNTPNENAFRVSILPTGGVAVGNTVIVDLQYVDASGVVLATHASIANYLVAS